MTKQKKLTLKANKITGLEEQEITSTLKQETKQTAPKKKPTTQKGKSGPKRQNGTDWVKSMIQLDPETKKLMLQQIALSDTIKTQSVFIDQAIKHYIKHLESK